MRQETYTQIDILTNELDTLLSSISNDTYADIPEQMQALLMQLSNANINLNTLNDDAEIDDTHWTDKI